MEYKEGDVLWRDYKVIDVKRGGFGIVYICYSPEWDDKVAIKSIQDTYYKFVGGDAEKFVNSFYTEAETWIKLGKHDNIVEAHFVIELDYKLHILMEYVEGGDLEEKLAHDKLSIPDALFFAIQFCNGMTYANSVDLGGGRRGIVHRDIKPSNIMFANSEVVKITDFGLVKVLSEVAEGEPVTGTPEYMSPEQFETMNVDTRADIYSFGVVLYEMLSGRLPFSPIHTEREKQKTLEEEEIVNIIDRLGLGPSIAEKLVSSGYKTLATIAMANSTEISAVTHLAEETARRIIITARWDFHRHNHQFMPPPPLRKINPLIHENLELVVMKCLEKQVADRYQNFEALGEELKRIYQTLYRRLPEENKKVRGLTAYELTDKGARALTAMGLTNKGASLHQLGKTEEALSFYNRALETDPENVKALYGKGQALSTLERLEEAIDCFDMALKLDQGNILRAHAWAGKGVALKFLGRNEEALECVSNALKLNPMLVEAWFDKGSILGMLRRYEEAIECYDRILEMDSRNALAWSAKGLCLRSQGKDREALECLKKGLEINPRNAVSWKDMGFVIARLGKYAEAIECFNKSLDLNSKDDLTWFFKALALYQLGRVEETLQCLNIALQLNPRNIDALKNKGAILARLNRFNEALTCIDKMIEIDPRHAVAWQYKGDILCKLGKIDEALECYEKAKNSARAFVGEA